MKKVLALVLAVIMVCTMAMAVEIGTATEATTPNYDSNNQHLGHVLPGKSIIFTRSDLNVPDSAKTADVKVAIAFEKGADLIASQGWVKTLAAISMLLLPRQARPLAAMVRLTSSFLLLKLPRPALRILFWTLNLPRLRTARPSMLPAPIFLWRTLLASMRWTPS